MKSALHGKRTSGVEVTNISPQGFWILIDGREIFLPFTKFPWFRDAAVRSLTTVPRPHANHLYWPDLDVDLSVESIEHPDRFPLLSKRRPNYALNPPARRVTPLAKRSKRRAARSAG